MTYLLDADVLIHSKNKYYKFDQVPEYWGWVIYQCQIGNIKINRECYSELTTGTDKLAEWAKQNKKFLLYESSVNQLTVNMVLYKGYAVNFDAKLTDDPALRLTEIEIAAIGKDQFLIAHAFDDSRTVVTAENSAPGKKRSRKKIPDVCEKLGVKCITQYEMNDILKFKTSWENDVILGKDVPFNKI